MLHFLILYWRFLNPIKKKAIALLWRPLHCFSSFFDNTKLLFSVPHTYVSNIQWKILSWEQSRKGSKLIVILYLRSMQSTFRIVIACIQRTIRSYLKYYVTKSFLKHDTIRHIYIWIHMCINSYVQKSINHKNQETSLSLLYIADTPFEKMYGLARNKHT